MAALDNGITVIEDADEIEPPPLDFLKSMMDAVDDEDQEEAEDEKDRPSGCVVVQYNSRKPLWWKKISGKPTKAQKRSIAAMEGLRLPKLEFGQVLDWESVFSSTFNTTIRHDDDDDENTHSNKEKEIWLEIGFGTGDNILCLAYKYPNRYFVGAEVHSAGLGKLCQRMHQANIQNSHWVEYDEFTKEKANQIKVVDPNPNGGGGVKCSKNNNSNSNNNTNTTNDHSSDSTDLPLLPLHQQQSTEENITNNKNNLYSNVRYYGGDGVKLLPYIPDDSLTAILVTFPDPFPKDSQAQYRVIQNDTLLEFYRILKKGNKNSSPSKGRLYLATDHEGHYEWCQQVVDQVNKNNNIKNKCKSNTNNKNNNNHETENHHKQQQQHQQKGSSDDLFSSVSETDRRDWLPVISKYEQKGWNEGRTTHLCCWQIV